MSRGTVRRRRALSVGQRLFLGLLPSLLAVALVVGLAYYGDYGRQAPQLVVLAAGALAVVSLVATWLNTRYLARRITRLAGTTPSVEQDAGGADELDRIEQVVDQLGSALTASEAERTRAEAAASVRLREHATVLSATVRSTLGQLDEVRLPLHILLEARFGDLNENQEELLGTARDAADAMDAALRRLGQIADADRGALPVHRELVQVNDLVRAVLPLARAAAERRGSRVDVDLEPGLPRIRVDRARLAEALALFVETAASASAADRPVVVSTARIGAGVGVTVAPPSDGTSASSETLAGRLIAVQGGRVDRSAVGVRLTFG